MATKKKASAKVEKKAAKETALAIRGKVEMRPLAGVQPNSWNPNRMPERQRP